MTEAQAKNVLINPQPPKDVNYFNKLFTFYRLKDLLNHRQMF
jgi:hypothetical protein